MSLKSSSSKPNSHNTNTLNQTELLSPINNPIDKWKLVSTYVKTRGLVKQHIESFNYFVDKGLKKILKANSVLYFEQKQDLWLRYDSIRIGKPSPLINRRPDTTKILTPQQCRISQDTYNAPIYVDISYPSSRCIDTELHTKDLLIGYLPIMLHSSHCHLYNKSETELSELGECIYDSGGYFIIEGQEKVMLIQEQLAKNRIIINYDDKLNSITAHVTSATEAVKSRTSVYFKNDQILIKHNSLRTPIPLAVLFRAMGIESDQEIVQMVGAEFTKDLAPSLQQAMGITVDTVGTGKALNVLTTTLAKVYIADRYVMSTNPLSKILADNKKKEAIAGIEKKIREGERVVRDLIFSHIKPRDGRYDILNKAIYLGLVVQRLIKAKYDTEYMDDKDYYGNKRLELSGHLLSLLFEDKFKGFNTYLQRNLNERFRLSRSPVRQFDTNELPNILKRGSLKLTEGITYTIKSGNWNLTRFKMNRQGVTQQVSRLSYISALGHMTRISSSVEKTRKTSGPRALHGSQWGMVCPSDTPEGEGCGLIKNLALMCHISLDEDIADYIKKLSFCLGMQDIALLPHLFINKNNTIFTVWLNGECIGVHSNYKKFVSNLRFLRRNGKISMFASICVNYKHQSIVIATDQGRVCRPLIICENGESLLTNYHLSLLESHLWSFDDFINNGIIEYLDVNEENNCLIALSDDKKSMCSDTTHLEIDPMTILGCVSGLIPFPHHNQSPRNTYQCAMGKQAMGCIGINKFVRCDHLFYDLCYTQQPMVQTKTIQTINFDKIPAGCNAILAVMSFSGYDIEDAIILNKSSLDRGFMKCVVNRTECMEYRYYYQSQKKDLLPKFSDKKQQNNTQDLKQTNHDRFRNKYISFDNERLKDRDESKYVYKDNEMALDKDGIAMPGATVLANYGIMAIKYVPKDATVSRWQPRNDNNNNNNNNINAPIARNQNNTDYYKKTLQWKHNNAGNIDKVVLTSNLSDNKRSKPMIIKVVTREHRRPELGDKFSSRHGQKGVCGSIVPQVDMPFTDSGIVPDLIMNPHGFPSRMTVGKMIELITGKVGVLYDGYNYNNLGSGFLNNTQFGDGSAFGKRDIVSNVCKHLVNLGYSYSGKDYLTCGITGNPLSSYIFIGPVFYQKLKHMVGDKMHARSRGPTTTLTRQPTEGRSRKGGLRVGEMERDCLIGHGASLLLYERLMVSSDKYNCQICKKCQLIASYENYCNYCQTNLYIANTQLPYACKLLFQELMSMNIAPKIQLTDQF
eukprot:475273_1